MSMSAPYFGDGKFNFIRDANTREMYSDAHRVITRLELWNWFRQNSPDGYGGYSCWDDPTMERINTELAKTNSGKDHSACTYGITMRAMKYIANHGYEAFRNDILSK